ncbi:MAG: metallopeptidase family protein [Deltaproteobacteria bacterium]|nr:metallopeptidase family protein [Deltaproteobacteria bacterium]
MTQRSSSKSGNDLLESAHAAIDHGDLRRARRILKKVTGEPTVELAFARWRVAFAAQDPAPALPVAEENIVAFPESADLHHALGRTLMELQRPEQALAALEEACYLDQDFADAWYDLAIVRSELGDTSGMRAAFTEVYELDCAEPLPELRFSPEQVQAWAQRAFDMLPKEIQERVADVPVFIADYPEPWIVEDAPWDPRLLGLFDGPTWAELKAGLLSGHAPHVYLFHRNLERVALDPREMAREVRVTVHHELGHFLGLDEHDLDERGLG